MTTWAISRMRLPLANVPCGPSWLNLGYGAIEIVGGFLAGSQGVKADAIAGLFLAVGLEDRGHRPR